MEEGVEEMDEEVDEEEWRAPTSRGRPESIMWDMMLSGPPRLLGYVLKYYNKLVVQDPIQKYNYRPELST